MQAATIFAPKFAELLDAKQHNFDDSLDSN